MKAKGNTPFNKLYPGGVIAIVAVYLVLAVVYSVATPIFEASDEIWHYPYVKLLAEGKGLPVQTPRAEDNLARQEGSQPPLYYALSALATFWIDTGDFASLAWVNPHALVGDPLAHGNKNMALHTSRDDFPYHGVALAVEIIRWLSILLGAATLLCIYATVRQVLPSRPEIALGSAALVAFNPQFAFISASVNNDNLIITLCSLIVLLLTRYLKNGMTLRQSLVLGLALGLALLSKLTALGLIPLILVVVALLAWRQRSLAHFLTRTATIGLLATVVAGWWYVRNWQLYGDPTGLSMMLNIVGIRVPTPGLFDLLAEFEGFRISFWALFGAVNVLADSWIYRILDGVVVLALSGLLLFAVRELRSWTDQTQKRRWLGGQPPFAFHLLVWERAKAELTTVLDGSKGPIPDSILLLIPIAWLIVVFGLFIRWTQTTLGSQGRLVFPALSGIALFLALGLASLAPKRLGWLPLAGVGAFLLALSAVAPFRYIEPAYALPHLLAEKDVPSSLQRVNIDYGGKLRLLGYDLDKRQLKPGDQVKVTLYWQSLAEMSTDYSIFIHFDGRGDQSITHEDSYPGLGTYPTRLWKVGDTIAEEHCLIVARDAAAPALVRLVVGLYNLADMRRLTAYDATEASLGDAPVLAELKLASLAPTPLPSHPVANGNLSDVVELVGYDLPQSPVRPGDSLKLTLYWRAKQDITKDYTVFTQLLSSQDLIFGQHDRPPLNGDYPTRLWAKGEVIADEHNLPVQGDAQSGKYRLIVGMYLLATNQRLTLAGSSGQDYIALSEITISPPQ